MGVGRIPGGGRGGESGLLISDYTLKARFAPRDSRHRFDVKLQFADQVSDQSYLGLTDADFARDPFRRYGVSALDEIETDHGQVILRYAYALGTSAEFSAVAYNNTHARNWFKTEGIDFDGSEDAQALSRTSWSNVIRAANESASLSGLDSTGLLAILHGIADTPAGSIQGALERPGILLAGPATGGWRGIQPSAIPNMRSTSGSDCTPTKRIDCSATAPTASANGTLVLDDAGLLGNAGNRIRKPTRFRSSCMIRITIDRWSVSVGLRYEDIEQERTR